MTANSNTATQQAKDAAASQQNLQDILEKAKGLDASGSAAAAPAPRQTKTAHEMVPNLDDLLTRGKQ